MKASEAKKLGEKAAIARSDITSVMAYVYTKIKAAASKGQRKVEAPLLGIRQPVTPAQYDAVQDELVRQGYTVSQLSATRGGPRFEVSW